MHCTLNSFTKSQSRQSCVNDSIYAQHERKHATLSQCHFYLELARIRVFK